MSFSYPSHLTILTWVFSDFFFWLTTKCPHAVPKCKQLSYQYIWPTLVTYNKSCGWCEVKKTNFPTRALWTVFRPIIADGKPSCPWLVKAPPAEALVIEVIIRNQSWLFICLYSPHNKHKHVCCNSIDSLLNTADVNYSTLLGKLEKQTLGAYMYQDWTGLGINSFSYQGAKIWNVLSEHVKDGENIAIYVKNW